MKRLILKFIEKVFLVFFNEISKKIYGVRPLIPKNIPFEIFEVFENLNKKKNFDQKIILPYIDLDLFKKLKINNPYEILEVEILKENSQKTIKMLDSSKASVLPIALLNQKSTNKNETDYIKIEFTSISQKLELKYLNRFHYLPLKSDENFNSIKINSGNNKIAIGKPIICDKNYNADEPKLIVHIFIDALTQSIIEKFGYKIMPYTEKYFKKNGIFYTNTYAQSEWTLSSMAGIFTGKYTNEHLIYHPRKKDKIKNITLADILQKKGYLTYACTNVPKLNPINGFDKGFDRYILAGENDYNYIINEACEQLDAFKINQYLFLGFFDIHESHELQPISSQVSNELKDFQFKELKGNSKDTSILYDEERINMFKNSITHFDKKLQRLYDEIDKFDKEALVVLHSDHGVNFMTNTTELLGKEREKVIFLYKGNKKHKIDNEIKEIRELPSMICNDLKINNVFDYNYDGYAISESLYPYKDYEVAVRNKEFVLFFKVAWKDVKDNNILSYIPKTTFHFINKEEREVDFRYLDNKDFLSHLKIAEDCFIKVCSKLEGKER